MSEEQLILVDERNRATGSAGKTAIHRSGLLHRAFSIFMVDDRGRIVLQQRSREKYHSGGLWANSCCGHPRPGERTLSAARRRLGEELGVTGELSFGFFARYEAELGNGMHENEFVYVYFGRLQAEPKPDPAEIADVAALVVRRHQPAHPTRPRFVYVLVQALFSEPWRRDRATGETHRGTLARLIRLRAGHSEHSIQSLPFARSGLAIRLDSLRRRDHVWQCQLEDLPVPVGTRAHNCPSGRKHMSPIQTALALTGAFALAARMAACHHRSRGQAGGTAGRSARALRPAMSPRTCSTAPPPTATTSCTPTATTRSSAIIRPRRSTPPTCGACVRPGSSRPTSRNRWKRRRSSSTASCTSRPRSATSMRSTRRPASSSGTTSTRSDRSRPIAAARTIAASRSTKTRSISPRSMPSWSRSTPRPATSCGRPTSPIPSSATARRWRRPWSRARC